MKDFTIPVKSFCYLANSRPGQNTILIFYEHFKQVKMNDLNV